MMFLRILGLLKSIKGRLFSTGSCPGKTLSLFYFSISLVLFLSMTISVHAQEDKTVYGFFSNETSSTYLKMIIIGEVVGVEKASEIEGKPKKMLIDLDTRPDTVTIKVIRNPGIKIGQTLYLVEKNADHDSFKNGNIVGQIKVVSIYKTTFFGQQLRAEGHLRLIEDKIMTDDNIMTVAMPIESERLQEAIVTKKQGDYFATKGDFSSALTYYKKSIRLDENYPDAHYALAKLHNTDGEGYISAAFEFSLAWAHKDKFQNELEKFEFYLDYARFLINKYKIEAPKQISKDIETCIEVSKEALKISQKSFEPYYYLAEANYIIYRNSNHFYKNLRPETEEEAKERSKMREENNIRYEDIEKNLEIALKLRPQSYKVHSLAVIFYYESLGEFSSDNVSAVDKIRKDKLIEKIKYHGKNYRLYLPKNVTPDKNILTFIDTVNSR